MFLSAPQIVNSIRALSGVHPFYGITFLACKLEKLPVGQKIEIRLDAETNAFLQRHHKLDPSSDWLFQPFKSAKRWVRYDYSSSGLQAINTQTFNSAFLHDKGTRLWGWSNKYIDVLTEHLTKGKKIPAFDLAVWLLKDEVWPSAVEPQHIVQRFLVSYSVTKEEETKLFDTKIPTTIGNHPLFSPSRWEWKEIRTFTTSPPDAKPDEGGTLAYLETHGIGPADHFALRPARRLSLITGDNGLGKSFLLETAWWALTGTWAGPPSYPNPNTKNPKAEIIFEIEGENANSQRHSIAFDWKKLAWPQPRKRPTIPGLIIYARVDGSFAIWDPARQPKYPSDQTVDEVKTVFSRQEVWDGKQGRIEGLIRDWTRWQNNAASGQFATLQSVLTKLSPPDLGQLLPGKPVRIPDDPRDIPTLVHPYGETPIVYASAGVKRVVTLAYLIVWAWHEHLIASNMARAKVQNRMVILIDEIEAHLHPHWQRSLLPALMEVNKTLSQVLEVQHLIATHSPLVMASSEAIFDPTTDKLFHLDLEHPHGRVTLDEVEYVRFGDVSSWLTSPIFELKHARSNEGERAIEAAKKLQLSSNTTPEQVKSVTSDLKRYLAQDDRFWPRWIAFAERYGVII